MSDLSSLAIFFCCWAPVRIAQRLWLRPSELIRRGRRGLGFSMVVADRAVFLALLWVIVPGDPRHALGLDSPGRFGWAGAALLGLGGVALAMALAGILPALVVPRLPKGSLVREAFRSGAKKAEALRALAPRSLLEYAFMMLGIVFFAAGFGEEVMYRGFLQGRFESFLPAAVAGILQTALFGAEHYVSQGLRGAIEAFLAGSALTLVFVLTGSLAAPVIAHTLQDAVGITALYHASRRGKLDSVIRTSTEEQ